MLVERSVKDRYALSWYSSPSEVFAEEVVLLTANRPQSLKVRSLRIAGRTSAAVGTSLWGILVIGKQGETLPDMDLPSGADPVVQMWYSPGRIIWTMLVTTDTTHNEVVFHRMWNGDGIEIRLQEGDYISWVAKTKNAIDGELYGILDIDVTL